MPKRKPRSSSQDGKFQVLIESRIIKKILLISTTAVTGPAGPRENAVWMNELPIVSNMLPMIPIRNRFLSND